MRRNWGTILLQKIELFSFIIVSAFSIYASINDLRELNYPKVAEYVLYAMAIFLFPLHLYSIDFSSQMMLSAIANVVLTFIVLVVLYKLGCIGLGDVKYLLTISVCFPSYPVSLASFLSKFTGFIPNIARLLPFSFVIITNTLYIIPMELTMLDLVNNQKMRKLYSIYSIALLFLSINFSPKIFLWLPIPSLITHIRKNGYVIPLIPSIFIALIFSIIFGDLSMWLCR